MLRARLSGLTEAILRISEDLNLDLVLQEIVDSARSLTDARYGAITTLDESGELQDLLISGMTPEERQALELPQGRTLFRYLTGFEETLRAGDLAAHIRTVGFPEGYLPARTFVGTRIRDGDRHIGNIYIGERGSGQDFTREDEETLEMFAAQAAMAITNARQYGDQQRANADLEALVNTSPVGVLVLDAKTREVLKSNQEARRIIVGFRGDERDCDELLKSTTFRRMDGSEVPLDELPAQRAIASGEVVRAEEIVIHRSDGEAVTTLINATPIYGDDGETVSVVVTIQDITPLEELERLRAEFLGMVSHELRAPLTSIKGSAATVRAASFPLDPAEMRQFFRMIEEQADHMRDLINNLLDLTRIEAGTLSVAPEPTDVSAVIDQAKNAFLSSGYRNNIEVELMSNLPRIGADRQRLVQVLYNLFSNASEYSREWSAISVSASLEDLSVVVAVNDEGAGIAPEQLPHLFTKFSRTESGHGDRRVGGCGLGLAICKGIVEAHGGRIWAESGGEGRGTRFAFTVPTVDEAANRAAASLAPVSADSASAPENRERVLALDDDPQILRYIRSVLSEAGYTPIVTGDPSELEHLLEAREPHLVLLNLVLPGTDGFELMKSIPNVSEVPVIFISGRGGDQYVARAFEMGAADYILKPFSPTELVARIRAALRKRAAARHAEPYLVGDLAIDHVERNVTVGGRPADLTPTEYKLLFELSTNAGRVLTHDELLHRVWGEEHPGSYHLLRSFVKSLRQKLGDDARSPRYIFTEAGAGYRLTRS